MPPVWDPAENDSPLYKELERHSDGMISFAFTPPPETISPALQNTETCRNLIAMEAADKKSPTA